MLKTGTPITQADQFEKVNRAFSSQSFQYDADDNANIILRDMRIQVHAHVQKFINPSSRILELNAGTGIDAFRFAQLGHTVHATDLSTGMVDQIKSKIAANPKECVTVQQISYTQIENITNGKFDYVFSNFGGLNCIEDLRIVTRSLAPLLAEGAFVTFVIMPSVCLWELMWMLKGDLKRAFRRFSKTGVMAHLEGQYFKTYYHDLDTIKASFPADFKFISSEGLCAISPPPGSTHFVSRNMRLYQMLRKLDGFVRTKFPFDRWADHIIVTFKYSAHNR